MIKKYCIIALAIVIVVGVVFFRPVALVPANSELVAIHVYQEGGNSFDYELKDSAEFFSMLKKKKCRRIIDTAHSFHIDKAKYDIILNTSKGSYHILIGEPDSGRITSLINKAYYSSQRSIKYKIINYQPLVEYLDRLVSGTEID